MNIDYCYYCPFVEWKYYIYCFTFLLINDNDIPIFFSVNVIIQVLMRFYPAAFLHTHPTDFYNSKNIFSKI